MLADLAFVGLGSNMGNRTAHLAAGLAGLRDAGLTIRASSSLYLTEPDLGAEPDPLESHPWYVNCVAAIEGCADAVRLLELCLQVEAESGRQRSSAPTPQPRPLDLDVLLTGSEVVEQPALQVPHPRMHERRFVLQPLCELDPDLRHPLRDATVRELLEGLESGRGVWVLAPPLLGGDD